MRRDELQEEIINAGYKPQVCPKCNKPTLYPRQSKEAPRNAVCRNTGRYICRICGQEQGLARVREVTGKRFKLYHPPLQDVNHRKGIK